MINHQNCPVLILNFNRPELTLKLINALAKIQPAKVYFACDGARAGIVGEEILVNAVKNCVAKLDWDVEVYTLFHSRNLGCALAVTSAITWFFSNESAGIILEDDCIPTPHFFRFCAYFLKKYESNEKIFGISGDGRPFEDLRQWNKYSYSKYPAIWGWATWARAWRKYNLILEGWPKEKNMILKKTGGNFINRLFWAREFNRISAGDIHTWDYQLYYSMLKYDGVFVVQTGPLVKNYGIEVAGSTHPTARPISYPELPRNFEINPKDMLFDLKSGVDRDRWWERKIYIKWPAFVSVLLGIIRRIAHRAKS